ncbi:MAG: heme-binding protein [Pseudomonadota bacterium]
MITLRKARTIVKTALSKGQEMGLKPLTVVVLDAGGHLIAAEREDGASPGRFDIARGKAYGCIMIGLPGSALNARAEAQHYFMTAMNGLYDGKVVPVQGGILVKDKRGQIIGAVGVTGDTSENDAEAGLAGVEKAGFSGVV